MGCAFHGDVREQPCAHLSITSSARTDIFANCLATTDSQSRRVAESD
ncbi:hypothetical protein K788_0004901 [Paraburkholderia caribensis MBA4]|uniref:Uncharacterized protein n=1 Tax=Paraburkholderia caribensis MBA4 TaxID=1323664 RepID=A0A0N7JTP8_9BURK|nr:hypothetical protein K788_0004901 [Paraburkholderia caribensis MBA4]